MGLNKKTMDKLMSEETLLGMEEREIVREFAMLSERISRHKRQMNEARDKWSKRYFEVTKKYLLDDAQFLKMIKLPEDFDR
tara:strand:- start:469 stop:711 length:243 start_codon:yes stop_codon:yes gene_type:complete